MTACATRPWPDDDVILYDGVCNLIARNRYRISGKYEECFVPHEEMKAPVMEYAMAGEATIPS